LSAEASRLPLAVRFGPPITVTCECGVKRDLRYGERWDCDGCGRAYDTGRIPPDEYAQIRYGQLRHAIAPAVVGVIVLAVAAWLIAGGRVVPAIVIVPFAGFGWSHFVRPARRRRRYKELAELPKWELEADSSSR
jgi:hypothetical protein